MDHLPKNDPAMLASVINRYLRDNEYSDLDDLCAGFDEDPATLKEYLSKAGYEYSEQHKKFI